MPKVCFVIGAGASCEYSFPSGNQLADLVRDQLISEFELGFPPSNTDEPFIANAMAGYDSMSDEYVHAARVFAGALQIGNTIDHTLDKRKAVPKLMTLGKLAIAHFISRFERQSAMHWIAQPTHLHQALAGHRDKWLHRLFWRLVGDRNHDFKSLEQRFLDCWFITFNYDRNIEQFFYYALQAMLDFSEEEARDLVNRMEIIHVFGDLGQLHFMGGNSVYGHPSPDLWVASANLHTYREEYTDLQRLGKLQRLIRNAEKIVYLGFGFAPENVDLLAAHNRPDQDSWATMLVRTMANISQANRCGVDTGRMIEVTCSELIRLYGEQILTA